MDQVFSLEKKNIKKDIGKMGKKYWKSQLKVREFGQSGKVGTMILEQDEITYQIIDCADGSGTGYNHLSLTVTLLPPRGCEGSTWDLCIFA